MKGRSVLALAVFILLAVVHTWPLARDPAHLSRVDSMDGNASIWTIAWVAHQLPRHPTRLFDANIFYPEPLTLAYSEAMVPQGILAVPVLAAGGSAVLAFNVVLLEGFALSGWAFCLLVQRWTGSWSAGYLAGSLAAFNAHTLLRLTHMQAQHVEFLALMLFALDRVVAVGRVRDAAWLGIGFALHGMTSIYFFAFSIWTLLFAVLARVREFVRLGWKPRLICVSAAVLVAGILLSPYLYAYGTFHELTGWIRGADEQLPGLWTDYLTTGGRFHFEWWSYRFYDRSNSPAFPGIIATALVVWAFVSPASRRDPRFRMCAAAAAGCAAVSFAAHLPFYSYLHNAIPLFQATRIAARLGQTVLLMIAVMAGFGIAALEQRWRNRRTWAVVALVLCIGVNLEALRAPIGLVRFEGISPAYDALASIDHAVVAELPFPMPAQWFLNAKYMLNSTRHWHPMLNGYSSSRAISYYSAYDGLHDFPSDASLIFLHDRGATHVVVHVKEMEGRMAAILKTRSLRLIASDHEVMIFHLESP